MRMIMNVGRAQKVNKLRKPRKFSMQEIETERVRTMENKARTL